MRSCDAASDDYSASATPDTSSEISWRVNNVVLCPGESHAKDARQFQFDHASEWIVISAFISRQRPGFVECVASLGGDRRVKERRLLVPEAEYEPGRHGFVIDLARHETYDGASGFIGWTG